MAFNATQIRYIESRKNNVIGRLVDERIKSLNIDYDHNYELHNEAQRMLVDMVQYLKVIIEGHEFKIKTTYTSFDIKHDLVTAHYRAAELPEIIKYRNMLSTSYESMIDKLAFQGLTPELINQFPQFLGDL